MLYAVAGDGTGNLTEIKATLEDLRTKATQDEDEFWFLLMTKDDPSKTEQAILTWLREQEIYFETIGSGYEGAVVEHDIGEDAYATFLEKVQEQEAGTAGILSLFVDNENESEEDNDLYAMIEAAVEAGVEVRLLNGQMIKLDLAPTDEAEVEAEDAAEIEAETEAMIEAEAEIERERPFTEAELKKMSVPELQALLKSQGISVKGSGKGVLIAAYLGADVTPQPAVTTPALTGATTGSALLVVVYNGTVTVKPISAEEAQALV